MSDAAITELPAPAGWDHERVLFCEDPDSGLRAIIAVHSTALGPALGGTRFHPYATREQALQDVLRLSRGMTYKNAAAGLRLGGGKAVIIGDPDRDKSERLLLAYGRFVASQGGSYITACDAGTTVADMDVVHRTCPHTVGRSPRHGGSGDSSVLTAYGVLQGIRAAARHTWGSPALAGRTMGVVGVGKVGRLLARHLVDEGADVVIADPDGRAVDATRALAPAVHVAASTEELLARSDLDVLAPCALGGAITRDVADTLSAAVICGAANNQLSRPELAETLREKGILYMPDFVVNSGGVIHVTKELGHYTEEGCREKVEAIYDTCLDLLERSRATGTTALAAAHDLARSRLEAAVPRGDAQAPRGTAPGQDARDDEWERLDDPTFVRGEG
ncbi:Glu/Leu/Phe/Val family dehydrogenase [Kitasatospora sp. NPDC004272]